MILYTKVYAQNQDNTLLENENTLKMTSEIIFSETTFNDNTVGGASQIINNNINKSFTFFTDLNNSQTTIDFILIN